MVYSPVPFREEIWRRTLAFFAAALVLFHMVCPVAPERWWDLYLSYGKTAIVSMAALYFFHARMRGVREMKLVVWYTIWVLVTRLLNTDLYLHNELDLVLSRLLCCVVLPVGLILTESERRRLLDVIVAVAGLYYFVTALLSLYACVFGLYFSLPPEEVFFGFHESFIPKGFYYINAWDTNRTISAVWFYLGWCMMVWAFFRCENKLWRIPICLAWLVFHLAVAFCFCRSVKLIVCLNVAMLAMLLLLPRLREKKRWLRAAVLALAVLICLPLTYKSFDWMTEGVSALYWSLPEKPERISDEYLYRHDAQAYFSDSRELGESISNASNRAEIYASVLPALRDEPLRILIGKYSSKVMLGPRQYLSFPYWHMHNYLLQVLMLTGVVGFLLVAAFSVFLVLRMLRVFFAPGIDMASRVLCLPLSGILVYGMFETVIFTDSADGRALTDFRELFFFLLAGILLAVYYRHFPSNNTNQE